MPGNGQEGKDTATNAQTNHEPQPETAEAEAGAVTSGNVVGIEQGRERRARRAGKTGRPERTDGRSDRTELKQDRADRRDRRKTGKAAGDGANEDAADAGTTGDDPEAPIEERKPILIAPALASSASPKTVERTRVQLEQAERAIAEAPDVVALVAPLVRHVNTVTEQLNDAQVALGRAMAERDALRAHLLDIGGEEAAETALLGLVRGVPSGLDGGEQHDRRAARQEARDAAAKPDEGKPNRLRPVGVALGFVPADESFDGLKRMARRRQLFAAVVLVSAFTALRVLSVRGYDFSTMSRDGLADLAYVGMIFQVFLMAWMFYRVVRVGGKGINWLFPDPNAVNGKKRRR